jgi:hypothetical protein
MCIYTVVDNQSFRCLELERSTRDKEGSWKSSFGDSTVESNTAMPFSVATAMDIDDSMGDPMDIDDSMGDPMDIDDSMGDPMDIDDSMGDPMDWEPVYCDGGPVDMDWEPVYRESGPVDMDWEPVYCDGGPVDMDWEPVYCESGPVDMEIEDEEDLNVDAMDVQAVELVDTTNWFVRAFSFLFIF